MAWTTPASYTASEVVTASKLNVHVRDNTRYLKDVLDGVQTQTVTPRYAAADAVGVSVVLGKARGASLAAPAIVSASDSLGTIGFAGYDGSAYREAAQIKAFVDGTPGASDMPGALSFLTSADAGITLTEQMRVNAAGQALFSDGSLSLPSLSFLTDPDTGFQRSTTNEIGVIAGGARVARFAAAGLRMLDGSSALPAVSFANDTDTGMYSTGAGIGFAVDATQRLLINSTGLAVTGTVTIGGRPLSAGARVYHNANQSIVTATGTVLALNAERYDSDGFHDTVTNNSRLTVPAGLAGRYSLFATASWAAVAGATYRFVAIRLNGATVIARQSGNSSASIVMEQNVACHYDLAVGDYVEMLVRQDSGAGLDVLVGANYSPEFGMQLIG